MDDKGVFIESDKYWIKRVLNEGSGIDDKLDESVGHRSDTISSQLWRRTGVADEISFFFDET